VNIHNEHYSALNSDIVEQFLTTKRWSNRSSVASKSTLANPATSIPKQIAVDLCAAAFAFLILLVPMLLMLLGPDTFLQLFSQENFSLTEWYRALSQH